MTVRSEISHALSGQPGMRCHHVTNPRHSSFGASAAIRWQSEDADAAWGKPEPYRDFGPGAVMFEANRRRGPGVFRHTSNAEGQFLASWLGKGR
jgi:hypothetical protein